MDQGPLPWRVIDDEGRADADASALTHTGLADAAGDRRSGSIPAVRWIAVIGLAVGLVGVAVAIVASGPQPVALVETGVGAVSAEGPSAGGEIRPATSPSAASIVVHVAGAVGRPGLVRLTDGARVADAIDAAGGLGPMADPERVGRDLNLAERLTDGERIVVPARDDPAVASAADGASGGMEPGRPGGAPDGLVDLNHADATALDSLPGVGPVTAAKIIAARTERPFTSLDELVQRKVVSASTLEKFRDRAVIR